MGKHYVLNDLGCQLICDFVNHVRKTGVEILMLPIYDEAEASANENDGHGVIEMPVRMTASGRPEILQLQREHFDAIDCEE